MDLCDYDFDIVFKKGKMNANADAPSRIKPNCESLKAMIPTRDEVNRILAITRRMGKAMPRKSPRKYLYGIVSQILTLDE